MRVCQFRHDGKWTSIVAATSWPPDQEGLRFYSTAGQGTVKGHRYWPVSTSSDIIA
jgi:hypothetical protein